MHHRRVGSKISSKDSSLFKIGNLLPWYTWFEPSGYVIWLSHYFSCGGRSQDLGWWTLRDSWEIKSAFHRAFQLPVLLGNHMLGTSPIHFRSKTIINIVYLSWCGLKAHADQVCQWQQSSSSSPSFPSPLTLSYKYSFIRLFFFCLPQGEKSASVSYPLCHASHLVAHMLTPMLFSFHDNLKCKPCSLFWYKKW